MMISRLIFRLPLKVDPPQLQLLILTQRSREVLPLLLFRVGKPMPLIKRGGPGVVVLEGDELRLLRC